MSGSRRTEIKASCFQCTLSPPHCNQLEMLGDGLENVALVADSKQNLVVRAIQMPKPGPKQVVVEVTHVAQNPTDGESGPVFSNTLVSLFGLRRQQSKAVILPPAMIRSTGATLQER